MSEENNIQQDNQDQADLGDSLAIGGAASVAAAYLAYRRIRAMHAAGAAVMPEPREWIDGNLTFQEVFSDHQVRWFGPHGDMPQDGLGVGGAANHDAAHILLALTGTPVYQADFAAEVHAFAIQEALSRPFDQDWLGELPKPETLLTQEGYVNAVSRYSQRFSGLANASQTLQWIIGGQTNQTMAEVHRAYDYDDTRLFAAAEQYGITFTSKRSETSSMASWQMETADGVRYTYNVADSTETELPRGTNGVESFRPFIAPSNREIASIFERISPVLNDFQTQIRGIAPTSYTGAGLVDFLGDQSIPEIYARMNGNGSPLIISPEARLAVHQIQIEDAVEVRTHLQRVIGGEPLSEAVISQMRATLQDVPTLELEQKNRSVERVIQSLPYDTFLSEEGSLNRLTRYISNRGQLALYDSQLLSEVDRFVERTVRNHGFDVIAASDASPEAREISEIMRSLRSTSLIEEQGNRIVQGSPTQSQSIVSTEVAPLEKARTSEQGIFSAEADIFHGTQRAFDSIRLPTEDLNIPRHAGDEYGVGFYTAITPDDPAKAQDYARGYTEDSGLILRGRIAAGQISLLNLDENLGAEAAQRLRAQVQALDTGNPELNRYYQHVAEGIAEGTNGRNVWSALSEAGPYERWHGQQYTVTLDTAETNATLRADRRTLAAALAPHSIELVDINALTPDQVAIVQDNLRGLNAENATMHRYYGEVADNLRVGMRGSAVMERLMRAAEVQRSVNEAIPSIDSLAMADVLDRHATSILNNAGMDGVIIPSQDTAVFKGRPAIDRLPELRVVEIVGNGPSQDRIHTDRPIAVGEVLIPAVSHNKLSASNGVAGDRRAPDSVGAPLRGGASEVDVAYESAATPDGREAILAARLATVEPAPLVNRGSLVGNDQFGRPIAGRNGLPTNNSALKQPSWAEGVERLPALDMRGLQRELRKDGLAELGDKRPDPLAFGRKVDGASPQTVTDEPNINAQGKPDASVHAGRVAGAAGVGMGVVGLAGKFGEGGTYAKDVKANAVLANSGVVADVVGVGAGVLEVAKNVKGMGALGAAAGVVSGGFETAIAIEQKDGKRAARAMGATAGGLAGGLAGAAAGAKAGAAIGAGIGVWFGGVGAAPAAAVGGVIGGLIGGGLGAWGGSESGGRVAEKTGGEAMQRQLDNKALNDSLNALGAGLKKAGYTKMLDKDRDGKIEAHEVRDFVGADGVRDLRAAAKNGLTGREVTDEIKQQLTENYGKQIKQNIGVVNTSADLRKRLDINGDGRMDGKDVQEATRILKNKGVSMDRDKDGVISAREFGYSMQQAKDIKQGNGR